MPNGYREKPAAQRKEPSKWQKFFDYASNISTGFLKSQAEIRKAQIEQQMKMQQTKQEAGLKFFQAQMEAKEATTKMQEQQQLIKQRQLEVQRAKVKETRPTKFQLYQQSQRDATTALGGTIMIDDPEAFYSEVERRYQELLGRWYPQETPEEILEKPTDVAQEDWNAASSEQRRTLLRARGLL